MDMTVIFLRIENNTIVNPLWKKIMMKLLKIVSFRGLYYQLLIRFITVKANVLFQLFITFLGVSKYRWVTHHYLKLFVHFQILFPNSLALASHV